MNSLSKLNIYSLLNEDMLHDNSFDIHRVFDVPRSRYSISKIKI